MHDRDRLRRRRWRLFRTRSQDDEQFADRSGSVSRPTTASQLPDGEACPPARESSRDDSVLMSWLGQSKTSQRRQLHGLFSAMCLFAKRHRSWKQRRACRVTDPWTGRRGSENFVVELFTNAFVRVVPLHRELTQLQSSMDKHRSRIEKARHKLTAHADRETIKSGKPLGAATWSEWDQFWKDLGAFVSLVHEHVFDSPSTSERPWFAVTLRWY